MGRGLYGRFRYPNSMKHPADPDYDHRFEDEDAYYDEVESHLEDKADDKRCGL